MHPRHPIPWILVSLFALGAVAPLAQADEHDRSDEVEDAWADETRDLTLELDHDGFVYDSTRDTGLGTDRIRTTFETTTGRLVFDFEADSADDRTQIVATLDRWVLIEYEDLDDDDRIGLGEPVLQRHEAAHNGDPRLSRSTSGPVTDLQVTYPIPGNGEWHLVFHLTDRPATTDGTTLSPTELTYDIVIDRFPYTSDTSSLALQKRIVATADADAERTDLPRLLFEEGPYQAFVQWDDTAQIDGTERHVETGVARAAFDTDEAGFESESTVTYHYPRGDTIVHGAAVGVTLADADALLGRIRDVLGSVPWLTVGIVAGVAVVAVTLGPRLRHR